jgi:hypothetical protein
LNGGKKQGIQQDHWRGDALAPRRILETSSPSYRCAECGSDLAGRVHYLTPAKTAYCKPCLHPGPLDRFFADGRRVRSFFVRASLLAAVVTALYIEISSLGR